MKISRYGFNFREVSKHAFDKFGLFDPCDIIFHYALKFVVVLETEKWML